MFKGSVGPSLVTGVINGLPVIDSNGTADMSTQFGVEKVLLTEGTIYMVGMQRNADVNNGPFAHATDNFTIKRDAANDKVSAYGGTSGTPPTAQSITDATFYSIRLRLSTTTAYISINNGAEVSAARGITSLAASELELFNYAGILGNKQIAEILVYTANHGSTDIADTETYLRTKYAHY